MAEKLRLKWGTIKGWSDLTPVSQTFIQKYIDLGASESAMAQQDTQEQKDILCECIDQFTGEIWQDWEGKVMTKDEAKAYVQDYGKK